MSNVATIVNFPKSTPVKRLLTDEEKEFVSLVASIIVTKTLNDAAHKNGDMLPPVQRQGSEQRKHRKAGNDNKPLGSK